MNYSTRVLLLFMGFMFAVATAEADETGSIVSGNDSLPKMWTYVTDHRIPEPESDGWWKNFNDSLLDSLIEQALQQNFNVSIAAHRMEIARQTLNQARSQYFPAFNFNGSWTKSRTSGAMTKADDPAVTSSYYSLGIDMNWQIDLFGKIHAASKNRKAQFKASRAQFDGMQLSVAAEMATYYINLRVLQAQKIVAGEHLASQDKIMEITRARYESGLASRLDVAQAQVLYYSTKATLPGLDKSIRLTINSIALLLGVYPDEIAPRLEAHDAMPDYRTASVVDIPAELLRRRPDVMEAEYNVAAYAAQLGIAKKDFLPSITLTGNIGTVAHDADRLFKKNSITYTVAPTLSWTIFEGMSRKYAVAAAREQMQAAIDEYNYTLLSAMNEAQNALIDYNTSIETVNLDQKVFDESVQSFRLSIDQYKSGLQSLTPVVDAQLNMISYSNSLLTERGNALLALVNLYKALGGGWITE